jgi:hypothetical protein
MKDLAHTSMSICVKLSIGHLLGNERHRDKTIGKRYTMSTKRLKKQTEKLERNENVKKNADERKND